MALKLRQIHDALEDEAKKKRKRLVGMKRDVEERNSQVSNGVLKLGKTTPQPRKYLAVATLPGTTTNRRGLSRKQYCLARTRDPGTILIRSKNKLPYLELPYK